MPQKNRDRFERHDGACRSSATVLAHTEQIWRNDLYRRRNRRSVRQSHCDIVYLTLRIIPKLGIVGLSDKASQLRLHSQPHLGNAGDPQRMGHVVDSRHLTGTKMGKSFALRRNFVLRILSNSMQCPNSPTYRGFKPEAKSDVKR